MYHHSLATNEWERSLAEKVFIDTKPNMSQQCALTVKKVKSILGCIRRNSASRQKELMLPLCSALR